MRLEELEGQPRAVKLLRRALADERVAHAWAFVGPVGSGRTTAALAFAQALLCAERGCGRCRACALVSARQHPDLHLITSTPPESNPKGARAVRIAAIRDLERRAALRPVLGPVKVFVVDDADRMTGEAPQAFLKTLEEPPPRTVLILVLPRVQAVPATVLSRCQIVRFVARRDPREGADRAEALHTLRAVRARGIEELLRRSQEFERDREQAERFVDAWWLLCRDLLILKTGAPATLLVDGGRADELVREAEHWNDEDLYQMVELCREARQALAVNVTPRLTIEVLLSRLALEAA